MLPSARAKKIAWKILGSAGSVKMINDFARALDAERFESCKAICWACAKGEPLESDPMNRGQFQHRLRQPIERGTFAGTVTDYTTHCLASKIFRALAEEE